MIRAMEQFEHLLGSNFELDDYQAVRIIVATAVSHKIPQILEMVWLRVIGASGTGKTELLRTLASQEKDDGTGFCTTMEAITAGAIRRGYLVKGGKDKLQKTLLERIDGKLVITKEFATLLTKDIAATKEIFGLLRGVHDGALDADYGSEQGFLRQMSRFDWIIGTTQYVDRQRQLETQLGSRFIDVRWGSPIERKQAVRQAISNDGSLGSIRKGLANAMADVIRDSVEVEKIELPYVADLADMAAIFRTPIEHDRATREIMELPEVELGTRMGQSLMRIARGLVMIGVDKEDVRSYLIRLVFDSMAPNRAGVIKAWLKGFKNQGDIAAFLSLSPGAISRVIEEIKVLGWKEEMLMFLTPENGKIEGIKVGEVVR